MKILTFNTWLLESPLFNLKLAKHLESRFSVMPNMLAHTAADIIFLQEVWKPKFRDGFVRELAKFGYHACYKDTSSLARMGNGLMIFSKIPFDNNETNHFSFSNITRIDETFAKKGVLISEIDHPQYGKILLANSHLGAVNFNPMVGVNPLHEARQMAQHRELVDFLKKFNKKKYPLIMGIDLNLHDHPWNIKERKRDISRQSRGYELILDRLKLIDTYRLSHPTPIRDSYKGETFSATNPYTSNATNFGFNADERVDYIFTSDTRSFTIVDSQRVFTSKLDSGHFLSDHFGVLTTINM